MINSFKNFHFSTLSKTTVYVVLGCIISVMIGVGIVYAITALTVTDSFTDTTKIASSVNVTVDTVNGRVFLAPQSTWTCGSLLVDSRDGKSYATVLIGTQCWMQENINVGTMINATTTQGVSTTSVQKWCYNNLENNCTTYGGLYQWNQAMGGSVTEGARGICPAGWHIPTHNDWTLLERTTCTSASCATDFPYDISITGARGTNEGTTLKSASGLFRSTNLTGTYQAGFIQVGNLSPYISSTLNASDPNNYFWYRMLWGNATVVRTNVNFHIGGGIYISSLRTYGFPVRCLKD